jgi:hypothetical protein
LKVISNERHCKDRMWEYDERNQRLSKKKKRQQADSPTDGESRGRVIHVLEAGDNHGLVK